jgi:ATP-dependent DNA helicase RecG
LNWFPGAAIQYVRYEGDALDSDPLDERRFEGDLITVLREIDGFLRTLFPSQPEPVSPLKEESRTPYPILAIRELLMNAVMHRDYESNAPIRFYWFSDHIEIQNGGGLYGTVTAQTFPNQNDYRNPKIAEAMKTLGYVNTFGHGIARAQRLLRENGNPPAEFDISQSSFFLAAIRKAAT